MNILSQLMADPHVAAAVAADPLPTRRAAYVSALLKMDWQFESSDDQRCWRAGRLEIERLRAEREVVDGDHALWKLHAHQDFRHG